MNLKQFKNYYLYLFFFHFLCLSCTQSPFKPRTIENYFQSAGVEKYFLSDIPEWANFSSYGACFRQYGIRFFDINLLMKSFNIDYSHAIQIQATFNDDYNRLFSNYKSKTIPLLDEQNLFYRSSEKVNGKIKFFEAPTFKRVHLIWIDSMFKSKEEEKKILDFLKSSVNNEGVPVLVSLCLTRKEMEEIFKEHNYKMITVEMLSIYTSEGLKGPSEKIYFDQFFKQDQELFFYSREKILFNSVFNGKLKFINF